MATRYVPRLEVVHFDFPYVGSSGPEGSEGLPEEDGFRYILVIMDDLSNFLSLEPAEAYTAEVTAKHLLNWCKTMGVPRVWVSDTATHLKNRVIAQLSDAQSRPSLCCGLHSVVQWYL